jgi:hypothetical protein
LILWFREDCGDVPYSWTRGPHATTRAREPGNGSHATWCTTDDDPAAIATHAAEEDVDDEDDDEVPAVIPCLPSPNFSCQYRLSPPSREVMAAVSDVAVGRRVCSWLDRWKGVVVVVVAILFWFRGIETVLSQPAFFFFWLGTRARGAGGTIQRSSTDGSSCLVLNWVRLSSSDVQFESRCPYS